MISPNFDWSPLVNKTHVLLFVADQQEPPYQKLRGASSANVKLHQSTETQKPHSGFGFIEFTGIAGPDKHLCPKKTNLRIRS